MSLLDVAYEDFSIVNKIVVDDGLGGVKTQWVDGPTFPGTMTFDNSTQGKIAQAMGAKSIYTFICKRNVSLDYHDVLRRKSDDQIFRVTSRSKEDETPKGAGLDMREYSAEEWELPNEP